MLAEEKAREAESKSVAMEARLGNDLSKESRVKKSSVQVVDIGYLLKFFLSFSEVNLCVTFHFDFSHLFSSFPQAILRKVQDSAMMLRRDADIRKRNLEAKQKYVFPQKQMQLALNV